MGAIKRSAVRHAIRQSKDRAQLAAETATSAGTKDDYPTSTSLGSPSHSEPSEEHDHTRRLCLQRQLRKTRYCMYHLQGVCQFGNDCAFAHGFDELQKTPNLRKTRLCKLFGSGVCSNVQCSFAHSEEELRSTDLFYKKNLCMWYEKGRCRNGSQCRFAHGVEELVDGNVPGPRSRGARTGNSTVHDAKASQKTLHNRGQPTGKGATTHRSAQSAMNTNKGVATPIFPEVNGSSLEPMFVQTAPQLGLHSTSRSNLHQFFDCKSQVDNAHQAAAMVTQAVNHAQTATWMQDTELRHCEWQMEQLQNASAVAAAAASAASDVRSEAPQSVDLQAGLEKLTQNVASLSLQLSRFQMQMQDRMHPMSADLMAGAALAQAMSQLPEPPAPESGLYAGLTTADPWSCSALFGVGTNGVPEVGNLKNV